MCGCGLWHPVLCRGLPRAPKLISVSLSIHEGLEQYHPRSPSLPRRHLPEKEGSAFLCWLSCPSRTPGLALLWSSESPLETWLPRPAGSMRAAAAPAVRSGASSVTPGGRSPQNCQSDCQSGGARVLGVPTAPFHKPDVLASELEGRH